MFDEKIAPAGRQQVRGLDNELLNKLDGREPICIAPRGGDARKLVSLVPRQVALLVTYSRGVQPVVLGAEAHTAEEVRR